MEGDKPERRTYILDSFAILAMLEGEEGSGSIRHLLQSAAKGDIELFLSLINLAEVLYITERERGLALAQATLAALERLPIIMLPVTRERTLAAAHIKANYPVSLADAFAVAAAQEFDASVLTGDPEFGNVEAIIQVNWLPAKPTKRK